MKKIICIILLICMTAALFAACGKKPEPAPTPPREPEPGLFEFLKDDRATVFAANFAEDKPVCVTYTLTDNGVSRPSPVYDEKTIDAVFEALCAVTVGDESDVFIPDYDRSFVFTMEDGREYTFSFNVTSIDVGGKDYSVFNDARLWTIDFPLYSGASLADIYAGGDTALASAINAAVPTGAEFAYNGGGVSFTSDAETVGAAAGIIRTYRPDAALDEAEFRRNSADETPFTLKLIMEDGSQYTFSFAGDCLCMTEGGKPLYYRCTDAVRAILALPFDGYSELDPMLDENGRKTVDDALISADEAGAVLLLHSEYIATGASVIAAWDVTVAGTASAMRMVYNYGAEKVYRLADGFTAEADGETFDRASFPGYLMNACESLDTKTAKKGLSPAEYDFLWRAQLDEAGDIVRMEKIDVA